MVIHTRYIYIYKMSHIEKIYVCVLIREEEDARELRAYVLYKHMDMYCSFGMMGRGAEIVRLCKDIILDTSSLSLSLFHSSM